MKTIIAAVVFALAASVHAAKPQVVEYCQVIGQMAGAVMNLRQAGRPMASLMPKSDKPSELDPLMIIMVEHAYASPRFSSQKHIQRAVEDFANEAERACFSANR